jgi:hypothetical protein
MRMKEVKSFLIWEKKLQRGWSNLCCYLRAIRSLRFRNFSHNSLKSQGKTSRCQSFIQTRSTLITALVMVTLDVFQWHRQGSTRRENWIITWRPYLSSSCSRIEMKKLNSKASLMQTIWWSLSSSPSSRLLPSRANSRSWCMRTPNSYKKKAKCSSDILIKQQQAMTHHPCARGSLIRHPSCRNQESDRSTSLFSDRIRWPIWTMRSFRGTCFWNGDTVR